MNSTMFERFSSPKNWDQISGREIWKTIFEGCFAEEGETAETFLPASAFFLLSGENGIGKNALAEAFAGEAQKRKYQVSAVYVEDLMDEKGDFREDALQEFRCCLQPEYSFLILRGLDTIRRTKKRNSEGVRKFAAILEKAQRENGKRILVATARDIEKIPERIRRLFQICFLQHPDEEEVAQFFREQLENCYTLQGGWTYQNMAKECSGYSYQRLADLAKNLKRGMNRAEVLDEKYILTADFFHRMQESIYRPIRVEKMVIAAENKSQEIPAVSRPVQQIPKDPLESLETESLNIADLRQISEDIAADLGKKPEDYTDEELQELGYQPTAEIPEDAKALSELSAEDREALCSIMDFDLF